MYPLLMPFPRGPQWLKQLHSTETFLSRWRNLIWLLATLSGILLTLISR